MAISGIMQGISKIFETLVGAAPAEGQAEDRGGSDPMSTLMDMFSSGARPSAPKMEASDQKMANFLAAGGGRTTGQDAAIRMLEGFIESTDSSLEGLGEFKEFGEGVLSGLIGKPVSFPDDPTAAKEVAQQLLDELKGTPAPARVVRDEMGEVVETKDEPARTAPRETTETARAYDAGATEFSQAEIQEFLTFLDEMAVPRSPMEMKGLRDATPQAEKDRMQALHKKFVDAGSLPPEIEQAYRSKHAAVKANIDQVPAMFVSNKPEPLSSDPKEGIEQLYIFAESNA